MSNNGLKINVASTNNGLDEKAPTIDGPTNTDPPSIVAPGSTTYYQELTTTTTSGSTKKIEPIKVTVDGGSGPGPVPDERRDKEATVRLFDEANGRVSSTAARRQLDRIAGNFEELADSAGVSSWTLVGSAIDEAVSSGSAFVAPKRIREILTRWNRDGVPGMYAGNAQSGDDTSRPVTSHVTEAVTGGEGASHRFVRTPGGSAAGSVKLPVDRDPADIWDSTCGLLQGSLTAAAIDRLRNGVLIRRGRRLPLYIDERPGRRDHRWLAGHHPAQARGRAATSGAREGQWSYTRTAGYKIWR
jgi:hypothetical protein